MGRRSPAPSPAARLLAAHPAAIVTAGRDGLITGWTGAAERLFGWPAEAMTGRPLLALFSPPVTDELAEMLRQAPAPTLHQLVACRRRRGEFMAAITIRRRPNGLLAVIRPAGRAFAGGARRPAPRWDGTLGRVVAGLSQVAGSDLAAIERTDVLAQVLVAEARRMIPDSQVLLSLVPADRQASFRIVAASGRWAERLSGREWLRAGTVAGRAMQLRSAVETVRLDELSVLKATIEEGRIKAGRLVPLWTSEPLPDGRDAIGVLGWYRDQRRFFTPFERRLMGEFARLASLMLQRTELAAAATRTAGRLEAVVEAARDLTRSLEAMPVLDALVTHGLAMTRADRAAVLRVEAGRIHVVAGRDRGARPPPVGAVIPVDAVRTDDGLALVRQAVESRSAVMSGGYQIEGLETGLETHPVRHSLALPVAVAREPTLVLVFSRRRDQAFTGEEAAMLETVAAIAGLGLRNASLLSQVQEADRVKTDFLNMAAHELRTPLTVVRGYLSMMADGSFGEPPAAWQRPVALLQEKCDELGRLVEELLIAARLETGRITLAPRPVDLNQLARQAVDALRPRARALDASLRFEPAPRPLVVAADPEHLLRAIDALLANALAYASGAPWVRVRARAGVDGRAELEVEDRGLGIPAEAQEVVFERFARLRAEGHAGGTGLGLHVARELAQRMGGSLILAHSAPGEGSRFVLALREIEPGPKD